MSHLHNKSFKDTVVKTEPFHPSEVEDIQAKLDKKLGPEYVSTRPGAGGVQVSYIEGWKALNLANQVFGFNGWFSEVKTINVDYLDERNGRYNVGLSVVVRVTLKDGSYHEDIGYGSLDNARTKAMAFEKAKKEAMTDGLKRALRCFGNAMGNCLYDKEYLSKISGVKCAPPDFDESNLFRFNDMTSRSAAVPRSPSKPERANQVPTTRAGTSSTTTIRPPQRSVQPDIPKSVVPEKRSSEPTGPVQPAKRVDNDNMFDDSLTFSDDLNLESEDFNDEVNELLDAKLKTPALGQEGEKGNQQNQQQLNLYTEPSQENAFTNETPSRRPNETNKKENGSLQQPQEPQEQPSQQHAPVNPPAEVSFVKARVAEEIQKSSSAITSEHAFNPQFISPSIRRTVDPTKSTPIKRSEVAPPLQHRSALRYDNPQLIPNRQIGKPRYPPPKRPINKEQEKEGSGTS